MKKIVLVLLAFTAALLTSCEEAYELYGEPENWKTRLSLFIFENFPVADGYFLIGHAG